MAGERPSKSFGGEKEEIGRKKIKKRGNVFVGKNALNSKKKKNK